MKKTKLNAKPMALAAAMALPWAGADPASAQAVVPIAGTGFSVDLIAEKTGDSPTAVTDSTVFARWVHVEEGAPNSNHPGFPSDGLFVSTKPGFETEFQLQPFDQPNHLLDGDRFTLAAPDRFEDLRFLMPGIGGRTTDNFQATVNFTDGSSTLLTTSVADWQASLPSNAADRMAIVRESWDASSYFANGIFPRQLDFTLSPEDQEKRVESIDFFLLDRMGVAAVSGTTRSAAPPFIITGIGYSPESDEVTLTWNSRPGESYGVYLSRDLVDWSAELDDNVPASPGEATSATFDLSQSGIEDRDVLYFRIERN